MPKASSSAAEGVPEGFFSDPVYGGNRNMVGWSMIGFPGTRYDYRDLVDRHNETLSAIRRSAFAAGDARLA